MRASAAALCEVKRRDAGAWLGGLDAYFKQRVLWWRMWGGGPAGWVGGILRGGWALRWSLRIPERRLEEQQVHGWAPCPRAPSSLPSFMALIFQ